MEAVCRLLAAIFTWCGVVGFAVYLLWTFSQSHHPRSVLWEPVTEAMRVSRPASEPDEQAITRAVHSQYVQHLHTWLPWFYSPLNLLHWAVALLCFSPALGLYMWVRYLTWRRQTWRE